MGLHWYARSGTSPRAEGFTKLQAALLLLLGVSLGLVGVGLILLAVLQNKSAYEAPAKPSKPSTATAPAAAPEQATASAPADDQSAFNPAPPRSTEVVNLGSSVTGAPIRLLMGSINQRDAQFREFTYQLGNETVQALANCSDHSWISYPERQLNRPQSAATERMLNTVCTSAGSLGAAPPAPAASAAFPGVAIVFDPPSNVRSAPGGGFLCAIDSRRTIRVGQLQGSWYPTSACGSTGFIHKSQVRF